MSTLASLAHLDRSAPHPDERAVWGEYRDIIETAIAGQPRSLQKRIGPSEIGTPCDRCLAHKLAGTPEAETHAPWLPYIGTAVHACLEDVFTQANGDSTRFLVESTVSVGEIGGVDITGHADLFDLAVGEVTDWKIVGVTTLRAARAHGPSATYRTQAHLYGRGFTRRGLTVNRVRIAYLPRNSVHLGDAVIWSEPYDEQIALDALTRANAIAYVIDNLGAEAGIAATAPHTHDEHSCARYPDGQPSASNNTTATLLNL